MSFVALLWRSQLRKCGQPRQVLSGANRKTISFKAIFPETFDLFCLSSNSWKEENGLIKLTEEKTIPTAAQYVCLCLCVSAKSVFKVAIYNIPTNYIACKPTDESKHASKEWIISDIKPPGSDIHLKTQFRELAAKGCCCCGVLMNRKPVIFGSSFSVVDYYYHIS